MSTKSHVELPGSYRAAPKGGTLLRPTNPDSKMDVTVRLRRKAALPDIDPERPRIMSRKDFDSKYGANPADREEAIKVFQKYGLTPSNGDANSSLLHFKGPVSAVENAFDIKLFDFKTAARVHRGRTGSIHIPQELDGKIIGVFGLDERKVVRERRALTHTEHVKAIRPQGLYGSQLAELYAFPDGDGLGQTIALLEFGGGYFPHDLERFCQIAGLSPVPTIRPISVDNAPTDAHDGQEGEVMLDVEVAASVCPRSSINVYFCTFDEQGWVDILDQAMNDEPTVISVSWGLAEDDPQWSQGAIDAINDALHQAALLGITVCVASGDDGSYDQVDDGLAHADFPAASPYVLGVGGTQFNVAGGAIVNEETWKNGDGRRADRGGSSGGGVSEKFPRPAWQTVNVSSINPHAIDGRIVPDVAALAGSPWYEVVIDSKPGGNGGTSAATPLWACLICRISAKLPGGKRLPFLTPLLYQLIGGSTVGASGCNDITNGDNDTASVGGYNAGPGFDAVTGWGSPNGTKLLQALGPLAI